MSRTQQHDASIEQFEIRQRDAAHQSNMGHHGLATPSGTAVRGIRAAEPQGSFPSYPEHLNSSYDQRAPYVPQDTTRSQNTTTAVNPWTAICPIALKSPVHPCEPHYRTTSSTAPSQAPIPEKLGRDDPTRTPYPRRTRPHQNLQQAPLPLTPASPRTVPLREPIHHPTPTDRPKDNS
ncbi:hypothetical protein CCUS01_14572 [Colletotrichum cuscutae]|uniref:Uncharacterized protein n=1 Tax=Colletotrichum cuscutae TaxID=1209917 RepID=A0AAJ0DL44_9PEZI|nr:hypothetical protein CCUS01_14572 [Colletotrichum cuscutae]